MAVICDLLHYEIRLSYLFGPLVQRDLLSILHFPFTALEIRLVTNIFAEKPTEVIRGQHRIIYLSILLLTMAQI